MPSFGQRFEAFLGNLLISKKERDDGLFTRLPPFDKIEPTLKVTSEVGPSNSTLPKQYSQDGENELPPLSWEIVQDAKEYIVMIEDPDAPLPVPIVHGLLYGISPDITSISHADLKDPNVNNHTIKNGSIKYGKTLRRTVYEGPRPVLNHGPHRYMFTVVALKQSLESLPPYATKADFLKILKQDDVLAWGEWIGVYERKLE
ncbi:phosphatidylethanolamine-binding protein [Umbelopsis sp. PMI_123]|jgi:Raf kinase inhibitor-like YbhB/YbcL family protein|nr:phosphatidylethanolamine-binding protein [Umbelopsis sp. PMI_123]